MLAHLRSCDACLNFIAEADPISMFSSIGGEDLTPPGGVDAFVADVMQQVQVSEKRRVLRHSWVSTSYRWAVAATLMVAGLSYVGSHRSLGTASVGSPRIAQRLAPELTRPVVEDYENSSATIVEVPSQGSEDFKVVMIFDESLPVDL
jgi:uncharacterized protein (DUF2126 family)